MDYAAPLPPTFPIILTMNLISLVNTDIALGQQSPLPHSIKVFSRRVTHSHSLQTAGRLKWSSTRIENDLFFTLSSAEFFVFIGSSFY